MPHVAKALLVVCVAATTLAQGQDPLVSRRPNGHLVYRSDEQGNRIPDFSHCGYRGSDRKLPTVAARVFVEPSGEDDTQRIQSAIDFVSQLPRSERGLRGAALLGKGEFRVSGQLRIRSSGVVLRGLGAHDEGTVILAVGSDRRPLIRVGPEKQTEATAQLGKHREIVDEYVPVGATKLRLSSTEGLSVGARVKVVHPSSKAWIDKLGIERLGWREGTRDIHWERTITSMVGNRIEVDVPLTLAIEKALCQGFVRLVDRSHQLSEVGIEDLSLGSDFDKRNRKDEEHSWHGIHIDATRDAWVRSVRFRHFTGGAVMLGEQTSRVTVQDCASFEPISEVGGYRRQTFFTLGQQCLFLRCWSEEGLHDFSVGHCAAGPNAFVNCYAKNAMGDSGPRESSATGVLFDNVRIGGNDLNLMNRWNSPPKAGWSAMNSLLWQCQAANVRCDKTPVANNWVIGVWATPAGNGYIEGVSDFVKPISLYQQQLRDRIGDEMADQVGPFLLKPVGATNPSFEQAKKFTEESAAPARQLIDLIRAQWRDAKRPSLTTIPKLEDVDLPRRATRKTRTRSLKIENGWLTVNGELITGDYYTPTWWRGKLNRKEAQAMGPAITRFAPGRHGTGLTDDLEVAADRMARDNVVGYDHHYGLWYDRRRDDHLMVQRKDGDVAPPFYEQPFARSGRGKAWDGLSRYDLTKFNHWYWSRLRNFAELGEEHGFLLFHNNYFQHNILEAGAHWADSPWRSANNVNGTDLPEPPPYVGDKRIFLDEQFYDMSNPHLRKLHRNYIRKCLNNFADQSNIVQLTSGEFTGPLAFMQFWIDTIVEWEQETGKNVVVALSCTKDVQDSILADKNRSPHVDVIDIRYWTYTENGKLYAPTGGKHLSPRQHLRQLKPASTSFDSIVRSIREYRVKFPDKAVTYNAHIHCRAKRDGWAILLGGGSMPNVPRLTPELATALVNMKPDASAQLPNGQRHLSNEGRDYLIYSNSETPSSVELSADANWEWCSVEPNSELNEEFTQANKGLIPIAAGRIIIWARRVD